MKLGSVIFIIPLFGLLPLVAEAANSPTVPSFAEPIPNTTATLGREAILKCTIDNLDTYKVAWVKVDTQTLLSYHTHVISRDRRLKISDSNKRQWFLHIKGVDVTDRGYYMCQINTEPMISQDGYLDVLVPPSIKDKETSTDTVVEEHSEVSLRCVASGYPSPQVSWRRENSKDINLGPVGNTRNIVQRVEGEFLNLTQVIREDMGAYLCIAINGVQPSVSKRILLQVNFPPKIRVANQVVNAAGGTEAILGCHLEASPKPLTSWTRHDGAFLINNAKYELQEIEEDTYKILMQLRIRNVSDGDFGHYKCVAKNTFGEKEGIVRLIEIITTTTTTMTTIPYKVFVPIQRAVTEKLTTSTETPTEKEFGVPTTNSLRDESHVVSSEKQLGPGKNENRHEDELQKRKPIIHQTKSKKPRSGSSIVQLAYILLLLSIPFNYISQYKLHM